jgi:hypothetical protein
MGPEEVEQLRADRARLKAAHGELFGATSALLFRHDPVGLNYESNTDEYDPEAGTVIPRLRHCSSAADVQQVLHEEFGRWFTPTDAGPFERYAVPAVELWELWQTTLRSGETPN